MITITQAKPSECQKIRKFEQAVWKEKGITSAYDSAFFAWFGYVYVAKDKGKIVGVIIAIKTRDNQVKVVDWLVKEKYRRQGIGLRLYKKLLTAAAGLTVVAFVDSSNIASLEAHQALGFKKMKKIKDPFYLGSKQVWWVMERK